MAVLHVGVISGNTPVLLSGQIMKYSEQRIPTLNEYCVVCDEQHVFQNGSMLKVSGKKKQKETHSIYLFRNFTDSIYVMFSFYRKRADNSTPAKMTQYHQST